MDGSFSMIPCPLIQISVFAVPKSMAMSPVTIFLKFEIPNIILS